MSSAYVPDDSHRLPDPSSRSAPRTPGGGLKILMYLVFVLALAATIIMFFVDSEVWLTVAVITSLWAAFFGAILVSRYSGILSEETSRRKELERRHRAEIDYERAEAQRREGELERDYNTRLATQRDETLEAIRKELEVMREQLTDLSGAPWTDEQVSLKARAERIIELERSTVRSSSYSSSSSSPEHRAATDQATEQVGKSEPQERTGSRKGAFATGTFAAVRWSGSDNQETTQIPMVVDTRGIDEDTTQQGEQAQPAEPTEPEAPAEPAESAGQFGRPTPQAEAPETPETPEAPQPTPQPAPEQPETSGRRRAAEQPEEAHGRRRADEHSGGVTVAELMAQMKKNAKS